MKPHLVVIPPPYPLDHDRSVAYMDALAQEHFLRNTRQWKAMLKKSQPPAPKVFINRKGEITGIGYWDEAGGQLYSSMINMAAHQPWAEDAGTDRALPGTSVARVLAFYQENHPKATDKWLLAAIQLLADLRMIVVANERITLGPALCKSFADYPSCYCETCGQAISSTRVKLEQTRRANKTLAHAAARQKTQRHKTTPVSQPTT
jgi:hypothetical protein